MIKENLKYYKVTVYIELYGGGLTESYNYLFASKEDAKIFVSRCKNLPHIEGVDGPKEKNKGLFRTSKDAENKLQMMMEEMEEDGSFIDYDEKELGNGI